MTVDQAIAFVLVCGLMVMFVRNRLRYDLVALLGLLAASPISKPVAEMK